jgi:hypothetical protein
MSRAFQVEDTDAPCEASALHKRTDPGDPHRYLLPYCGSILERCGILTVEPAAEVRRESDPVLVTKIEQSTTGGGGSRCQQRRVKALCPTKYLMAV